MITSITKNNIKMLGDTIQINGYNILWNPVFQEWHVTHHEVGLYAFKDMFDAVKFAEKG